MATVYKAPEGYEAPDFGDYFTDGRFDNDKYDASYKDYIARLTAVAKRNTPGDKNVGLIYRTPIADGYAEYMVWRSKPLQLIHIEFGDAWHASAPLIRGLRLSDIKSMARADAALEEMFARSAK